MSASSTGSPVSYLLYDPERTDYSVSEEELSSLRDAGTNRWKDFCLVAISLGIPCMINAIHDTSDPFKLSLDLFLNYLFGGVGIALGIVFGILWYQNRNSFETIFQKIKQKPKMRIEVAYTGPSSQPDLVGSIEAPKEEKPTTGAAGSDAVVPSKESPP